MIQQFDFFIPTTPSRTVTDTLTAIVELHDKKLVHIEEFYADVFDISDNETPDPLVNKTTNEYRKIVTTLLKSQITGTVVGWYWKTECWGVIILYKGGTENTEPCFKTEAEAMKFSDAIIKWLE